MPNANAPRGFVPIRHLSGGAIRENKYPIASASANAIHYGDLVKLLDTGYIDVAAAGDTNIIGVFRGCNYKDATGDVRFERRFAAGSATLGAADVEALVIDDPHVIYEVQANTWALTNNGNNADITATAGDAVSGLSRHSINMSSAAAATAQVRILRLAENSDPGAFARVECLINEHLLRSAVGI